MFSNVIALPRPGLATACNQHVRSESDLPSQQPAQVTNGCSRLGGASIHQHDFLKHLCNVTQCLLSVPTFGGLQ